MFDDKTTNYQLQLPHPENKLSDDVNRLRAALIAIDAAFKSDRDDLASAAQARTALSEAVGGLADALEDYATTTWVGQQIAAHSIGDGTAEGTRAALELGTAAMKDAGTSVGNVALLGAVDSRHFGIGQTGATPGFNPQSAADWVGLPVGLSTFLLGTAVGRPPDTGYSYLMVVGKRDMGDQTGLLASDYSTGVVYAGAVTDGQLPIWSRIATAAEVDALRDIQVINSSGSITLSTAHRACNLRATGDVTIPVGLSPGFACNVTTDSAGISLIPASGVTLRLAGSTKTGTLSVSPYSKVALSCDGTNLWFASGSIIS